MNKNLPQNKAARREARLAHKKEVAETFPFSGHKDNSKYQKNLRYLLTKQVRSQENQSLTSAIADSVKANEEPKQIAEVKPVVAEVVPSVAIEANDTEEVKPVAVSKKNSKNK